MRRAFIGIVLAASVIPLFANAHTMGVFYDATVDGVHMDIGYSSAAPSVGESVIFDFNLAVDQPASTKYTDVWVRVDSEEGNVVLATAVHNATFGGPRMSYVFPGAGKYTISVRYENEGEALAKGSFPITVLPAGSGGFFGMLTTFPWYAHLLAGLLLGALIALIAARFGAFKKVLSRA